MSGGSIYDLKKVLGHADVKTTERYAHLSADHLAGVRDIIKPRITSDHTEVKYDPIKNEVTLISKSNPVFFNERKLTMGMGLPIDIHGYLYKSNFQKFQRAKHYYLGIF